MPKWLIRHYQTRDLHFLTFSRYWQAGGPA
jgi:hypothetical protein